MEDKIMTECRYSEVEGRSPHFHNAYEMLFIREGEGTVTVSAKEYKVGANTLMFFSNLEEHVTHIERLPFRRYFVKLDPDQLNRQMNTPWQLSIFKNRPEGFIHYVKVDRCADQIDTLFRMLMAEENDQEEYANEMVVAILRQILILTYRCAPDRFAAATREEQLSCAQMQRWIETHFTEDIQIKDIGYVLAGATITKGQEVTAGANGLAAVAAAGNYVLGIALTSAKKDEYCRVQIAKYQKASASA